VVVLRFSILHSIIYIEAYNDGRSGQQLALPHPLPVVRT
jgi:hypothetical protein